MGRLSKKAKQERKEARTRYFITLALQSLAGALIFALILFIAISESGMIEILQFVQENHMEFKITFISLPIAFLITFGCNVARSYMLGELDK